MSKIPLVASADDLPAAIAFAQLNTESRWFVTHRADALKHLEDIPNEWSEKLAITAAIKPAEVTAAEKAKIDADVADGHEEKLPSAIVDPDNDGDDDLTAKGDTDHDGAAYRKSLGLKADSMQAAPAPGEEDDEEPDEDEDPGALTSATDYAALVAGGYYSDYGPEDDYDNYDIDTEMPVTASGQVIVATAFTADERQQYAKNKIALPDGSFPIPNKRFLAKAIRAIGRAKNNSKDTIRKHIVKRAKALGASYMLPDSYKGVTAASAEFAGSADQASNKAHDLAKALLRKSVAPITAAIVEERDQAKAALRERAGLPKTVDGEAVDSPEVPDGTSVAVVAANAVHDVEKAGRDFSEALHPRGKDGKFITKGGRVIADDGAGHRVEGTVEAIHAGLGGQAHIQIKTDQGHTVLTTADHVMNAPTAEASLTPGHGDAKVSTMTSREHVDKAVEHNAKARAEMSAGNLAEANAHAELAHQHNQQAMQKATADQISQMREAAEGSPQKNLVDAEISRRIGSKADTDAKLAEDVGGKVTPQLRSDTEKAAEGASSADVPNVGDTKHVGSEMTYRGKGTVESVNKDDKTATVRMEDGKLGRAGFDQLHDSKADALAMQKPADAGGLSALARSKQALRDRVQETAQDRTRRISNANVAKDEAAARKAAPEGTVPVYNVHTGKVEHVSQAEATAGHVRYGQSLGEGSPAAGQTIKNALDNARGGNHQEAVVEQLKRMGYTDRTAKGARNLTSKDKSTRIKVNDDGSFGMKVNSGNGVFSARKHGVDTSGDAHSVASALHEAGKAAPAVKPHANNKAEANVLQARKEVLRRNVATTAMEDKNAIPGLGNGKTSSKRYELHQLTNGQYEVTDTKTGRIEHTGTRATAASTRDDLNAREDLENRRSGKA